jgi:membrane protease YdiL (CAAX protease family)
MKVKTIIGNNKWLIWSSVYTLMILFIGAYINYVLPYSSEPMTNPEPWMIIIFGTFYLPIIILPLAAKRDVSDFGFTFTPRLAIGFVVILIICAPFSKISGASWGSAGLEAFARTGEEIFFRGFIFDVFYQLFSKRRRPWLWAVIASSILFAAAHTQTFQESFFMTNVNPENSAFHIIFERFINLFGAAIVFALVRVATKSILLPAIVHSVVGARSIYALPFVLVIYFVAIFWAYKRGERILFGFSDVKDG